MSPLSKRSTMNADLGLGRGGREGGLTESGKRKKAKSGSTQVQGPPGPCRVIEQPAEIALEFKSGWGKLEF